MTVSYERLIMCDNLKWIVTYDERQLLVDIKLHRVTVLKIKVHTVR